MYIRCYSSWADSATHQQLWAVIKDRGWISSGPVMGNVYFYIPETLVPWCLLIDSTMTHRPKEDWIV